ncbi:proteophosphoglycan ppg4 [Variovorax sp. OV700]|jgi:hypothetical protein|uniref:proteophosphoglycan ppg4 n=1 Tax=Variovorax sp. OV700 TaxID=1882826 RepID=UPI001113F43E|nr:proteophosphoglycan ppg4 [Variovorax sp. OV700]
MKIRSSMSRILVASAMAFAIAPAIAQGVAPGKKADMPPVSGNVQMPAGQQNQTGGPMGETGTTMQAGTPSSVTPQPPAVRTAAVAAAPAPTPAPARRPTVRRARADRG